ncbi:hypothetical protein [Achromobacter denitrificans]|uniref:hypothetical protein n=1 Tax=Achromobacter denitrificans TaxID=32002 RepID=UPI0023E8ECD6|nr:hypothetical protein [Achromobacter denitrificans]MDF3846652.1 hypothetical protein [Achromobacter denitrificans]
MSRQRTINDQIWRSNRLSGCTVEDRYALFYFLTSPFSNVIGAYEIVLRVAASEMGWDVESQLMNVIRRLVDADLIYFDADANHVWVKVWWDHNSAKMAVASTLRKKTLEQIAALPERWRNDYAGDFINRLPADDPLRDTVAMALAYPSDRVSTAYADPSDSPSPIQSGKSDAVINQGVSEADTVSIPYRQGMDRRPGNTTTNTNSIYNTTTTTGADHGLQYPSSLAPAERVSVQNLIANIPADSAQALLDELEGAIKKPGTIRTSKVAYLKGLVDRHRTGGFVPSAGIQVATRRERHAASVNVCTSEAPSLSKAESQARLHDLKAQLSMHTRMPR